MAGYPEIVTSYWPPNSRSNPKTHQYYASTVDDVDFDGNVTKRNQFFYQELANNASAVVRHFNGPCSVGINRHVADLRWCIEHKLTDPRWDGDLHFYNGVPMAFTQVRPGRYKGHYRAITPREFTTDIENPGFLELTREWAASYCTGVQMVKSPDPLYEDDIVFENAGSSGINIICDGNDDVKVLFDNEPISVYNHCVGIYRYIMVLEVIHRLEIAW